MDDSINLLQEEMINSSTSNWSTGNHVNDGDPFNFDPFNHSFIPSSSRLLNSNSDNESDFESASEFNDYASYPNCVYEMDFVTNLFESRQQNVSNVDDPDSISNPFSDALNVSLDDELGLGFGLEIEARVSGLRVVGIESDSGGYDDGGSVEDLDSEYPILWDCDDQRAISGEEFDWENVDGRTDDREGLTSMINGIEEISVSSEIFMLVNGMDV